VTKKRVLGVLLTAVIAIFLATYTLGTAIYEGQSPSLTSFALIHFAGYLFFLLMPVEALVPVYQGEGHAGSTLILVAVATALTAQAIDFGIGRAIKEDAVHKVIGEKRYERLKANVDRWGGWAILLFNLLPLSSPNMLLVAGIMRYSARKAFLFRLMGLTAKYAAIVYAYDTVSSWF
jgi:membrane protein DedA with SNARE-associated domain